MKRILFAVLATWNKQQWASASSTKGISFAKAFYAIRMKSIAGLEHPARLRVLKEDEAHVTLAVDCKTTRVVTIDARAVARFSCD